MIISRGFEYFPPLSHSLFFVCCICPSSHVSCSMCVLVLSFVPQRKVRDRLEKLRREVAIHGGLDHPNIVKCHEAFESNNSLYIVMELCTGGELYDRIAAKKKFSEVEAKHVFKQIVEGVKYLHDHKIAHCDLKPDNILYLDKSPDSPLKLIGQPRDSPLPELMHP